MVSRSELLELARLMERGGEFDILDDSDALIAEGIEPNSHEWRVIIDALRMAAATLPEPT